MEQGTLLIADDEDHIVHMLSRLLGRVGFKIFTANNGIQAKELIEQHQIHVALLDQMMPGMNGMDVLKWTKTRGYAVEVIIMTAAPTFQIAMESVRQGAYDFLPKPLPEPEKTRLLVERAAEKSRMQLRLVELTQKQQLERMFDSFVGTSPAMLALYGVVKNYAWSHADVLILGEPGVGKELVAQAIHGNSMRREFPFSSMSAPNMSEQLFESELFGHVKGAFTGADRDKPGMVEIVDGGTLFLDEIGDLSVANQSKLLRVLSSGEYSRLGESGKIRKANVRFICATNKNLRKLQEEGLFRQDLISRLDRLRIDVPPLRAHLEDVPALATHFLRKYSERDKRAVTAISPEALEILHQAAWRQGNVRQLSNVIEAAVVNARGDTITPADLPAAVSTDRAEISQDTPTNYPYVDELTRISYKQAKKKAEMHFANFYFGRVLERHDGVINRAAHEVVMEPANLRKKLKEIGMDVSRFRDDGD